MIGLVLASACYRDRRTLAAELPTVIKQKVIGLRIVRRDAAITIMSPSMVRFKDFNSLVLCGAVPARAMIGWNIRQR